MLICPSPVYKILKEKEKEKSEFYKLKNF